MSGLFNSAVLDVAIGLIFVYLLLAVMCTALNEWVAGILKTRAKMLEKGIKQLLDSQPTQQAPPGGGAGAAPDPNQFLDLFKNHPLVAGMMKGDAAPSYLSSRTFSTVVMDIATAGNQGALTFQQLEAGITALPPGDVKTALLAVIQNVNSDLASAQKAIEGWFNDTMDRVTGWYKRHSQIWTVVFALVVTILTNADTIRITRQLWTDPVERAKILENAKARAAQQSQNQTTSPAALTTDEQNLLGSLIGKPYRPPGQGEDPSKWWLEHILGLALTAIAVSLGAPFWFDTLKKLMNLRTAGKSPNEKKADEKSS